MSVGRSGWRRSGEPAVDRAAHRRSDPEWLAAAWSRARVVLVDAARGSRALVVGDPPALVLVDAADAPPAAPAERLFLGVTADGEPVFALAAPLPAVPGARAVSLRDVGHLLDDRDAELLNTAVALVNWHSRHRFSPGNGLPTTITDGGWSRVDAEGKQVWPRTDPAVIMLVHDGVAGPGGRCLLGHNAAWKNWGGRDLRRFSCLAGYVEPGESAEAAVAREVAEEVGVAVRAVAYMGSQYWPFPGSLMLGFRALADGAQEVRVDEVEIAEARWFTRAEVAAVLDGETVDLGGGVRAGLPMAASIAHELIAGWATG